MCQYAVTLLSGHYLCISMVLLTVGVCIQQTHTVAVMNRLLTAQREREREKVTCQCSWHFVQWGAIKTVYLVALSDRSNSQEIPPNLLPAKHLTGGLSENSTETLLRIAWPSTAVATRWQASHTLFFIKGKLSHSTSPQLYYILLWWRHILNGQKPRCLKAGLLSKYKLSIHETKAGGKT